VFHEIGHVLLHSKKEIFIEIHGKTTELPEEEIEANEFAENILIPKKRLDDWISKRFSFTKTEISEFAHELKVTPGILAGRLFKMGLIAPNVYSGLQARYK
jgi:Zn-dependent peptidase ImmA (M78 family)